MKSKVDKLDVDKSVSVPIGLSKLSDVVKNDVVKKRYIYIYIYIYPKMKILKIKYLTSLT